MFVMKKQQTSKSKSLLLIIIIVHLSVMFVVVVLAKSKHDHHHHHSDHQHGHQLNKARKIYNGRRASREEAKFMAAIFWPKTFGGSAIQRFLCSAVIITHDTVLTAAHCVENFSYPVIQRFEVLPGASHIITGYHITHKDLIRTIQSFKIHPEYESEEWSYDLAVIKIGPTPWPLGDARVVVAQMPLRIERQYWPLEAYGYGWEGSGSLSGSGHLSGYLNVLEYTRIYDQSFCELMFELRFNRADILFATKERSDHHQLHISAGQAYGDSGGGVFVHGRVKRFDTAAKRWIPVNTRILVGIHSSQRTREETMRWRTYFLHTNITTFVPWIKRYTDSRFETYPFAQPFH